MLRTLDFIRNETQTIASDFRFAARTLRKSPGFALVAILSLALGIGANTAIFSLIDAVMLRMLPVANPEQLVFVKTQAVKTGNIQISQGISNSALKQLQERATRVAGLAAYTMIPRVNAGVDGRSELASAHFITGSYHSVLGVIAIAGRTIVPEDNRAGGRVAVISYGYWQRRFGRDPRVIGSEITLNSVPFTIIGVTPREFYGLSADTQAEIMIPAATKLQVSAGAMSSREPAPRDAAGSVFARLASGVRPAEAEPELTEILRQAMIADEGEPGPERRASIQKMSVELTPASQGLSRARNRFSEPLEVLMVVVGLVMLIACANIANLLLARSAARRSEIGIRLSLGSSRARLIRQLLTESLLLSILGGVLGILFAVWARDGIVYLATTQQSAPVIPAQWNLRVFGFTAAICVLNAFLFGIAPALRATRIDLAAALKAARTGRSAGRIPLGRALVAGQVAVSLALLTGAMLLLGTFRNLDRIDLGFARDHTLLVTIDPSLAGYRGAQAAQVYRQVVDRVAAIPGVRAASLMRSKVLSGDLSMNSLWVPGYTPQKGEDSGQLWVVNNGVGPRFFGTSGMQLIAGRDFSERDNERAPKVAVVNETMAQHYFGTQNPIGRRIGWERSAEPPVEIVGVVRDPKYIGVREEKQEVVFTPFFQETGSRAGTVLIRTAIDPAALAGDIRAAIRSIDANLPIYDVTTMDRMVGASLVQERLMAILSGFFGVLALGLSAVGLYGVLSYAVAQRTSEIGLRMALGAQRSGILRMILGDTARLLVAGVAIGIAVALSGARLIRSMLFGITPTDAFSLGTAAVILVAVALVAGFLPARRASLVDPMVALRHE